jgi:hypothetical protein
MCKLFGYDAVTAKSHGDAMEDYRQAKDADKPLLLPEG